MTPKWRSRSEEAQPTRSKATWLADAVRKIHADANRSADTHLLPFPLPREWNVQLYLKDESVHPTGSLKHRLARSLFLYGLCNGRIGPATTIIEASSGSTAVSEAWFAKLLGLDFVAVMPASTSPEKLDQIRFHGGRCHLVEDPATIDEQARQLAAACDGCFLDQFTNAERATDWRGNNNIAESIFDQLALEPHPVPRWLVVGAGTGGTSATLGRYVRYRCLDSEVCVVDPEGSVFADFWETRDPTLRSARASRVEGIGRQAPVPSFLPEVIDRVLRVPDAATLAGLRLLEARLGRRAGPSTGTNLYGALTLVGEMVAAGEAGSVVTLLCDRGDRYDTTWYSPDWIASQGLDLTAPQAELDRILTR